MYLQKGALMIPRDPYHSLFGVPWYDRRGPFFFKGSFFGAEFDGERGHKKDPKNEKSLLGTRQVGLLVDFTPKGSQFWFHVGIPGDP